MTEPTVLPPGAKLTVLYDSRVRCGNCGHEERIKIPKGQAIAETSCPRCGCVALARVPGSMP